MLSVYQKAVTAGFRGTYTEWLNSLTGDPGFEVGNAKNGASAYELAVANGFTGTLEEWLDSLQGKADAEFIRMYTEVTESVESVEAARDAALGYVLDAEEAASDAEAAAIDADEAKTAAIQAKNEAQEIATNVASYTAAAEQAAADATSAAATAAQQRTAAEMAAQEAVLNREAAQQIKDSTAVQFDIKDTRVGFKRADEDTYKYTPDLTGPPGPGIKVLDKYDSVADLTAAYPDGSLVEGGFLVGATEPYDYYYWSPRFNEWKSAGKLQGAAGKSAFDSAKDGGLPETVTENVFNQALSDLPAHLSDVSKHLSTSERNALMLTTTYSPNYTGALMPNRRITTPSTVEMYTGHWCKLFTISILAANFGGALSLLVYDTEKAATLGILNVFVRAAASVSDEPRICTMQWALNNGFEVDDFVLVRESDGVYSGHVRCKEANSAVGVFVLSERRTSKIDSTNITYVVEPIWAATLPAGTQYVSIGSKAPFTAEETAAIIAQVNAALDEKQEAIDDIYGLLDDVDEAFTAIEGDIVDIETELNDINGRIDTVNGRVDDTNVLLSAVQAEASIKAVPEQTISDSAITLEPNKKYYLGIVMAAKTITFGMPVSGKSNDWELVFTMGPTVQTITFATHNSTTIKWLGDKAPTYTASKAYRIIVSYDNGTYRAVFGEFEAVAIKTLGELSVGDTVTVDVKPEYQSFFGNTITFKVADKNHSGYPANSVTLITDKIIQLLAFDGKEPTNSNSYRQNYGNNRYSYANLLQWMNSNATAGNWYSAKHAADAPPNSSNVAVNAYDTRAGFLAIFDVAFVNALMETTLTVVKPSVDGGGSETVTDKVFLASRTEVGLTNEGGIAEGVKLALFSDDTSRLAYPTAEAVSNSEYTDAGLKTSSAWYWWLRTPYVSDAGDVRYVYTDGTLSGVSACNGYRGVRPLCNLPSSTPISDTPDANGHYKLLL